MFGVMKRVLLGWLVPSLVLVSGCKGDEGGSSSTGTEGSTTAATMTEGTTTAGTTTEQPTTGPVTEGTTSGPPGASCLSYEGSQGKIVERNCGCAVEQGLFDDLQTCVDALSSTPEEVMCRCGVYDGFGGSDAVFACLEDAVVAATACLTGLACDEFDAADVCYEAYNEAAAMCGGPNKEAEGQVALQCEGGAAFMCTSGDQVPAFYVCDMVQDCADGSDEAKDECIFTCMSGEEVPIFAKCNGEPDCMDMSDEPAECYFMCMSGGEQILAAYVCDGEPDCMDASDEAGDCTFMCMSGETVPKAWVCDGIGDCMDESDEANCP